MKRTQSDGSSFALTPAKQSRTMPDAQSLLRYQNRELSVALKNTRSELERIKTKTASLTMERDAFDAVASTVDRAWRQLDSDLARVGQVLGLNHPAAVASAAAAVSEATINGHLSSRIPSRLESLTRSTEEFLLTDVSKLRLPTLDDDEDEMDEEKALEHALDHTKYDDKQALAMAKLPAMKHLDPELKKRVEFTASLLTLVLENFKVGDNYALNESDLNLLIQVKEMEARARTLYGKLITSRLKIFELQRGLEDAKDESNRLSRRLTVALQTGGMDSFLVPIAAPSVSAPMNLTHATAASTITTTTTTTSMFAPDSEILIPLSSTVPPALETGQRPQSSLSIISVPESSGGEDEEVQAAAAAAAAAAHSTKVAMDVATKQQLLDLRAECDEFKNLAQSRLEALEQARVQVKEVLGTNGRSLMVGPLAQYVQSMIQANAQEEEGAVPQSHGDLVRSLEAEKQETRRLLDAVAHARKTSFSALEKLKLAEAKINEFESAADVISKANDDETTKELTALRLSLDERRMILDTKMVELETAKATASRLEEFNTMMESLRNENLGLKEKLAATSAKSGGPTTADEVADALAEEIETISAALNESRESNSRLQQMLADRDRRIGELETERVQTETDSREVREERTALALRAEKADVLLREQSSKLSRLEERLGMEISASQKTEQLAKITADLAEKAQTEVDSIKRECETLRERVSIIPNVEEELKMTLGKMEDFKWDFQRSEDEVARLRRRLERAKTLLEEAARSQQATEGKLTGGGESTTTLKNIDEMRLEAMELALRCPVYQNLWKDCVITKCAHMFSKQALFDNLAQRNRKCPSCKNTYSKDDIMSVYLYQSND